MLVLTRKAGEEILIGGSIRVKILSVKGNKIQIGFEAPPEISIVRQELLARDAIVPESLDVKKCNYRGRKMATVPTATSA